MAQALGVVQTVLTGGSGSSVHKETITSCFGFVSVVADFLRNLGSMIYSQVLTSSHSAVQGDSSGESLIQRDQSFSECGLVVSLGWDKYSLTCVTNSSLPEPSIMLALLLLARYSRL